MSNRDDEVLPLREGHNWRIRFEGADLKEVFLLPQSTSALREHEVGARGDYDKDKKVFFMPYFAAF